MIAQWVAWCYEERRAAGTGKPQPTKVPVNPKTGRNASSSDPRSWGTFDEAWSRHEQDALDGVGFVLTIEVGIVGIDLDHCRDPQTGVIDAEALTIVREIDSYTEVSPSGTGVRIFARGTLPKGRRKRGRVEMYDRGRYLTVTGCRVGPPKGIEERTDAIARVHARVMTGSSADRSGASGATRMSKRASAENEAGRRRTNAGDEALDRLRRGTKGARFSALYDAGDWRGQSYPSQSEADLALCSMLAARCKGDAALVDALFRQSALMRPKWDEAHYADGSTYGEETVQKAVAGHGPSTIEPPSTPGTSTPGAEVDRPLMCTDTGNAERFVRKFGKQIRYCHPWKKHLFWDRKRWKLDDCGMAMRYSKDVVRSIYHEAASCNDQNERGRLSSWAFASEKADRRRALVELAKSEPEIVVVPDQLDRDPMLLNCANGTLDLRTGELREHRRDDNITKLCPVAFDSSAKAPTWDAFLERVLPDQEIRDFVQRAVGSSLTGDVSEQVFFFLFGTGANGKSVFLATLLHILGSDYAIQAAPDLVLTRRLSGHPTDIADLFGKRVVSTVEVGAEQAFDEVLIKQLTGGDRIRARRMREDFWEFEPTHHLWIAGNHKPVVRGTDHAIWRRILLVPFTVTIPKHERDRKLLEKLATELPGILAWAVRGCQAWRKRGLDAPAAVLLATEEYRSEMNIVGRFLSERCVRLSDKKSNSTELFKAFSLWCDAAGEQGRSQTCFGEAMSELGFVKRKINGLMWYLGVALTGSSGPVREGWGGSGPNSDISDIRAAHEETNTKGGPDYPQPSPTSAGHSVHEGTGQDVDLDSAASAPAVEACRACGGSCWWRRRDSALRICVECHPPLDGVDAVFENTPASSSPTPTPNCENNHAQD